jgi:hypothetical protein
MSITDNDCDLPPPDISAMNLQPDIPDRVALHAKLYSWTLMHGKVVRLLRDSSFMSQEEVEKLDDRIQAQYEKMPRLATYNPESQNTAWYLDNHIFVHNTKLRVFRHNLTPNAPLPSRLAALRSCIELAKETSSHIAERFKNEDEDLPQDEIRAYNQRVIRIIYPEQCLYLYSCAMYLIAAKSWNHVLPLIYALRTIGNKVTINKCCCRYLWGVIIFTEGKDSILQLATDTESEWTEPVEEILAFIAADMHQDARSWEAVWQKDDGRKPRILDISVMSSEEVHHDFISEESDVKSGTSVKTGAISPADSSAPASSDMPHALMSVGVSEDSGARPLLSHRWSGEDETWETMLSYIAAKCDEQRQMEDVELTTPAQVLDLADVNVTGQFTAEMGMSGVDKETIQRRMSIANLL